MTDKLQRFLFDDYQIRGEIAQAQNSFQALIKNHQYSTEVANLMGELLIATTLLTATLKFEGKIVVQLQGDGPLSTAVINSDQNLQLRGMAHVKGDTAGLSFKEMVGKAHMMITITPNDGERYQGIVALENNSLSTCLEDYFKQSEQLATRIVLHADASDKNNAKAGGLFLQVLPSESENHQDNFQHVATLAMTVKEEELYTLSNKDILYRLYHQEEIRLFEIQPITYQCSCSKERCLSSLASIPKHEVEELLKEKEIITMHCEYCATDYNFNEKDLQLILQETNTTQH
jgi:molecular chaperone Hsp33